MELNNETLRTAIKLWLENEKEAIRQYGHISEWNTRNVTYMSCVFHLSLIHILLFRRIG